MDDSAAEHGISGDSERRGCGAMHALSVCAHERMRKCSVMMTLFQVKLLSRRPRGPSDAARAVTPGQRPLMRPMTPSARARGAPQPHTLTAHVHV